MPKLGEPFVDLETFDSFLIEMSVLRPKRVFLSVLIDILSRESVYF